MQLAHPNPAEEATATRAQDGVIMVPRRWVTILLCVVLFIGGFLRFRAITSIGVRFDDEACYVAEARLWHRCAKTLLSRRCIAAIIDFDKKAVQNCLNEAGVDFNDRYLKPSQGYTILGAITMFVTGDLPEALCVLNAMAGTISILVLYLIGTRLFSSAIGLAGASVLATSPYHLVYCRSALPEPVFVLFVLLGTLAWIISTQVSGRRWVYYLVAGLSFGSAATVHYRSAYVAPLLLAIDYFIRRKCQASPNNQPTPRTLPRWLLFGTGAIVPTLVLELVFQAASVAAKYADGFWPLPTFLEGAWRWYELVIRGRTAVESGLPIDFSMLGAYGAYFVHWHGAILILAVFAGVIVSLRSPGWGRFPAAIVLVTLGILLSQRYVVARTFSAALPFACLCAGIALVRAASFLGPQRARVAVAFVVVLFLCAAPAHRCLALTAKRSQIEDACAAINGSGPGTVALSLGELPFKLYLDKSRCIDADRFRRSQFEPHEAVAELRRMGVRWVVLDPQVWHYVDFEKDGVFQWWREFDECVTRDAVLTAEFPHVSDACWEFLVEDSGDRYVTTMNELGGGRLRVFDLTSVATQTDGSKRPANRLVALEAP